MVPRLSILAFWICNPRSYIVESICLLYASSHSMFFSCVSTSFFSEVCYGQDVFQLVQFNNGNFAFCVSRTFREYKYGS